jgi:thioredoxin-related protein
MAAFTLAMTLQAKDDILTSGAELGKWTMDIPAAKTLSQESNKPIFVCFTGSDWCSWCKMMETKVFSTDTWKAFAKENLVTLWIDFPKDKTLVPEKLRAANDAFAKEYRVDGFPTYIIMDAVGNTIGTLGASSKATPEAFIKECEEVLVTTSIDEILSEEDYAAYKALKEENATLQKKVEEVNRAFINEMGALNKLLKTNDNATKVYINKAIEISKAAQ